MVVRSIRFVLLLLLVVAAFGASTVRAHAAAEVRNEESQSIDNHNDSAPTVKQTKFEEHTTQTEVVSESQVNTVGSAVLSEDHQSKADVQAASFMADQPKLDSVTSTNNQEPAISAPVHAPKTLSAANQQKVLAAESQITPIKLESTTAAQSVPQPNLPVSHSNNPLMVLLAAASSTVSVLSNTLATWLTTSTSTVSRNSMPELAAIILTSFLVFGVAVTFIKRMRFARAARSNPADSRVGILQFAKSSSVRSTTRDSVFLSLVSNKIMKLHNVGGIQ